MDKKLITVTEKGPIYKEIKIIHGKEVEVTTYPFGLSSDIPISQGELVNIRNKLIKSDKRYADIGNIISSLTEKTE